MKIRIMKGRLAKYITILMAFVLMFSISAIDAVMNPALAGITISGTWLVLFGSANGVFDDADS